MIACRSDLGLSLVLFMLTEPHRRAAPTLALSEDLSGLEENPYRLIKLWWALPAAYRERMAADGLDPFAFQAAVLTLYREHRWRLRSGVDAWEVGDIRPLGDHVCAGTLVAGVEHSPPGAWAVEFIPWLPVPRARLEA